MWEPIFLENLYIKPRGSCLALGIQFKEAEVLGVLNFHREWLSSNILFVAFFLFFNCVCYDLRFRVVFSVVLLRDILREFLFLYLAGCLVGNGMFVWREALNTWK